MHSDRWLTDAKLSKAQNSALADELIAAHNARDDPYEIALVLPRLQSAPGKSTANIKAFRLIRLEIVEIRCFWNRPKNFPVFLFGNADAAHRNIGRSIAGKASITNSKTWKNGVHAFSSHKADIIKSELGRRSVFKRRLCIPEIGISSENGRKCRCIRAEDGSSA